MPSKIPDTMLAAQVVEFNKPYKIHEVPTVGKDLDEHDILVKVAVGSLCHTDFMVLEGIMGTKLPCIPSHEGAGTVVKLGSAVKDFEVGDRILCGLTYHRCGVCADCTGPEHEPQYCRKTLGANGITRDGSFAEYEVVDGRECCILPDNLSFESAAPLACAGITVWSGLMRANLKTGESVAIVGGGGGLGHLGVQFAKALGLNVIAIDARDEGLQLAKDCGADTVVDARQSKEKVVEEVKKVTNGRGADATLNVSDHNTAAALGAAVTKTHGLLIQIAQPPEVSIPFPELVFRDIRIHGSLTGSRDECQKMLNLVSENKVNIQTNAFKGLEGISKAIELTHSGKLKGKAVIIIDEEAIEKEKKLGLKMV